MICIKTAGDLNNINAIRDELMSKKLIACGQIYQVNSQYFWEGQIKNKNEYVLECRAKETDKQNIINTILTLHTYQLPEIIWYDFTTTKEYINWIINKDQYKKSC